MNKYVNTKIPIAYSKKTGGLGIRVKIYLGFLAS